MESEIDTLANLAAEKIHKGKNAPHAVHSVLKGLELSAEEREKLFHDILSQLSRRSRARRKKNKEKKIHSTKRLEEAFREERNREAARLAFERGDHLLTDP